MRHDLPRRLTFGFVFEETSMRISKLIQTILGPVIVVGLSILGWSTHTIWKPWLIPAKVSDDAAKKDAPPDSPEVIKLSAHAQTNLRLNVKEIELTTYWRKLSIPGTVVDRPGHSDRTIAAPIAGFITQVTAVPGKSFRAGDELFRLRLASDSFQTSQMELFKSVRELDIARRERKRLEAIPAGTVPATRLLELQYQEDRLSVVQQVHRQDLRTRQLTEEQIAGIEQKGLFVTEVVIRMPDRLGKLHLHGDDHGTPPLPTMHVEYEVQDLKVNLGDFVQAGQVLVYLADHRHLYVDGRALRNETSLIARATKFGLPVEVVFAEDEDGNAIDCLKDLTIEFLGNTMDASGLTLPVYIPFANPTKTYERQGKTYRTGQYRPGQKALVRIAVAKHDDVFVLPVGAVAREGPDAYVFKQNGNTFVRKAVTILHEDSESMAIANNGAILAGQTIAHNAAAALNRALKAGQSEGGGGHHHHHHD